MAHTPERRLLERGRGGRERDNIVRLPMTAEQCVAEERASGESAFSAQLWASSLSLGDAALQIARNRFLLTWLTLPLSSFRAAERKSERERACDAAFTSLSSGM